ncbi:SUKH-4 family immunity protein [Streptomyces sp. CT34]|uniref:SUKH-4 family immunity protein n=1 Tax=Streptomyces sp. CT34 TaxID=1553907 RepID=UPI0005BB70B4|nr:SUKH-4 family immunity protein [Streptomyces sp. CT34]
MTEPTPDHPRHTAEEAVARVLDWWENGRDDAGRVQLAAERDGPAVETVVRRVHQNVPGSVLLDATGRTAEELLQELLESIGVPESARSPWDWDEAVEELGEDHLVLISHAPSAGPTRRSAQPEQLVNQLAVRLGITDGLGVVLAVPADHRQRTGSVTLCLDAPAEAGSEELPLPVQALAFSEPRQVPPAVWRELIVAVTAAGLTAPAPAYTPGPPADDAELASLAEQFADHLRYADGRVSFRDDGTADAIRRAHGPELLGAVGRHMVSWLRERAAGFRHPDGWAASGGIGRYAAEGIAMHAVQAGLFAELLADGTVVAHLPQAALLDAAHCAYDGSLPGNNPAADAVHLQMYGLARTDQPTWAAWLHLMATARNDTAFAGAVERSGIRLPWRTLWTHWRPPGGYHHTYLRPGSIGNLFSVRWQGRPAVLSDGGRGNGIRVWDPASGELLAGPWATGEDFPAAARPALTWAAGDHDTPGPAALRELRGAAPAADDWEGALEEILFVSLTADAPDPTIVVAGAGGLFAVRPEPGEDAAGLRSPDASPLLGATTAAGAARPADAPDPSPQDLTALHGAEVWVTTATEDLPEGLTDPTARRVLTGTGLPDITDRGLRFEPSYERFLWEIPWPEGHPQQPTETGPFFQIGMWMGGEILIDGPTGHILRRPGGIDDPTAEGGVLVATGLDNFLTMAALWLTGRRILADVENSDEAHLLRQHIDDALWTVDWHGATAGAWTYPLHNE